MYEELELLETDSELPAYNAVCDLVEEVERLKAACSAKEAELAELRAQTAELFGARLDAEGMSEEAVTAAKAMWQHDPENAARAVLGCDIAEAANPYGCNQYGHEWKGKPGEGWKPRGRDGEQKEKQEASAEKTLEEEVDEFENDSESERRLKMLIRKRDLQQAKDKALDIRESTKYRQRDPETVKQYEEAKKEANERAKRLRATLKAIGERRGWDKKKIDYMLRRYPETVIDF